MIERDYIVEIFPHKFYFATVSRFLARNAPRTVYVTVDDSDYPVINSYFGPPSLSDIYRYCVTMQYLIQRTQKRIIHWSSYLDPEKYTNAVFLVGALLLLAFKKKPEDIMALIRKISRGKTIPFRDTTNLINEPTLDMKYFFYALEKAGNLNWFSLDSFDSVQYDLISSLEGGDMNWIVPGKLIALSEPFLFVKGKYFYIQFFKVNNVSALVRLNSAKYEKDIFENNGIEHIDLQFHDGGVPSASIVRNFLQLVKCCSGAIAVHCRAGLGRTGTLIGAYILNTYPIFTALEATAWIRLCRPGSIIGLQQKFLMLNEKWLKNHIVECDDNKSDI